MALTNTGSEAEPVEQSSHPEIEQHSTKVLMLGALGVVYGDIGTSPIYAFREALVASSGGEVADRGDILGVLSLIIWSLTIIVTIKYINFVLRADNRGEGGVLSLMALARGSFPTRSAIILAIGIVGASLFFGDAVITPAISVLSAVEGMNVVTPTFQPYVVPLTLVILAILFSVQRFGTGGVALIFGPITAVWFLAIGLSGLNHIIADPEILWAVSPHYIVAFLINSPDVAFVTIGAIFLAVTGAEALYADLGHFGRKPIVLAWLWIVFPCLLLNYAGQGAFVLAKNGHVGHPFFEMNEGWTLIPMVVLATAATVIASQAVISGAFSLTRQAVQLNMLPRLEILHTSERQSGQIYMPRVNLLLALVVMMLVVGFGESSKLASAYGISVTGNMLVTTVLLFVVMTRIWKWRLWVAVAMTSVFMFIDIGFFASNIIKVFEGGWASLAVAFTIVLAMWTWVRGSRYLFDKTRRNEIPLDFLAGNLLKKKPQLVSGTAVFLTSDPQSAPTALMHSLKHYKVLHEQNVILSVVTAPQPLVPDSERVKMETVNELFMRVTLTFGYMEQPNIPRALAICRKQGWKFDIMTTSFFLSRRSLKASPNSGMPVWQDRLFIGLLKAGYRVRTTVRSARREADVLAMLKAGGTEPGDALSFAQADLMVDAGWPAAAAGCDYVLHVASPFPPGVPRHEDELILPAREGALRVLRAARDADVKRVVLTSSFAAVGYGKMRADGQPFNEENWTDPAGKVSAYVKSKTLAERAAWDFIAGQGGALELAVVNPVGIFGPVFGPDHSTSTEFVQRMLNGAVPGLPRLSFGVVDARDVADLHVRAMTNPAAKGERFLAVAGDFMTVREIAQTLKTRLGPAAARVSTREFPDWLVRIVGLFSPEAAQLVTELGKVKNATSAKAVRMLGWAPRSREDALAATGESLIRLGLVKPSK